MSVCTIAGHEFQTDFHTRECRRCGRVERADTCGARSLVEEPAGTKNVICGHFAFSSKASIKELWNQYRLARAYQPCDIASLMMELKPPRWFRFEVGIWK